MIHLKSPWIRLKSSLWFVPSLMILLASGLAVGLIALDDAVKLRLDQRWPLIFGLSAEGSRVMLSAIATSMVTIAGVTFSITIVTLSLAANQYTPRVLRNFMRDRANQTVLGGFVSIYIYCLLVLRTIRGGDEPFIPALSVVMALVLAIGGIGMLIFFIHHIASAIQVSTMLGVIARETVESIKVLFPEEVGEGEEDLDGKPQDKAFLEEDRWETIPAEDTGYVQSVDSKAILRFAEEHDTIVSFEHGIGDFVVEGTPIARIRSRAKPSQQLQSSFNDLVGINSYRTIDQDPAYGVRQISDIAVKALSPGINDPTTAESCLDYLGLILQVLIGRRIPSPFRYHERQLRVIARGQTFDTLLDLMMHQIRQNSGNSFFVIKRMVNILKHAAKRCTIESRREALWRHICLISEHADLFFKNQSERRALQEVIDAACEVFGKSSPAADLGRKPVEQRR